MAMTLNQEEQKRLAEEQKPAGQQPEVLVTLEKEGREGAVEKAPPAHETATPPQKAAESKLPLPPRRQPPVPIPQVRDELTIKIEKIMEEGLGDVYQSLSPIAKQELKIKGEKTAVTIRELLNATHVRVKKIFRLIVEWLKILPGINRFFLEQEAKIKTDRILMLK